MRLRPEPGRPLTLAAALAAACSSAAAAPSRGVSDRAAPVAPEARAPAKRPRPRAPAPAPIGAANAEGVRKLWEADAGKRGLAVSVSRRDGVAASAAGGGASLWALATGKRARTLDSCAEVVRGGLGFHEGKLVVVCERAVERWDPRDGARLASPPIAEPAVTAAHRSGPRLALAHRDGVVRIVSLAGDAPIEVRVPGPPIDVKALALTPDGKRLAVAWTQGSIWWWDTAAPDTPHDLVRYERECDALAWSPGGGLLAEEGAPSLTTVWTFGERPARRDTLRQGAWLKRLLFTPDERWLVRAGSEGLELAEIAGPRRVALDARAPVEDAAFDEGALLLGAIDRDGRLTLWGAAE
ncbi:MAG: WD40 repeat domain-containing protein [Polyangiaceae bacterium]|nr:WD40 repeat domain-containing protein [Polyangiaceae bacterium]